MSGDKPGAPASPEERALRTTHASVPVTSESFLGLQKLLILNWIFNWRDSRALHNNPSSTGARQSPMALDQPLPPLSCSCSTHFSILQGVFPGAPFHRSRISGVCVAFIPKLQKKPHIFFEAIGPMELSMVLQIWKQIHVGSC